MKQFVTLVSSILFISGIATAQYFQGSATQDFNDANSLKIAFKMKPTANIITAITYMEAAFRYPAATTQAFTITSVISNTSTFPGLTIQRLPDYVANGYTYVKFVFNTGTVPAAQYFAGTEYPLFTITTSLPFRPVPLPVFEMISNLVLGQYQFGVADGAGNFIDPGTGPQLYGANFRIAGSDHIIGIPVSSSTVPVKFNSFNVISTDKHSLLSWTVENQDAGTNYFEIERSYDGTSFTAIDTVRSDLSAGSKAVYTFTDPDAGSNPSVPVVYYRIRQVDVDGRYIYTAIRSRTLNAGKPDIGLYPNPAGNHTVLFTYLSAPKEVLVEIVDATGKKMRRFAFTGTTGLNRKQVDVSGLPRGMYSVIISGETTKTAKLFKTGE